MIVVQRFVIIYLSGNVDVMKTCNQKYCKNKLPSDSAFVNCDVCRARETRKKQESRTRRTDEGCCFVCGVLLTDNTYKRCQKCLERKRTYAHVKLEKIGGKTTSQVSKKALWEKARDLRSSSKDRALSEGSVHKIAIWHIYDKLVEGHCEITGLPFVFGSNVHGIWSPSLDRWDPKNPNYTEDNIKVCVWGLNQFKFRWSTQDWLILLKHCLSSFGLAPPQPTMVASKMIDLDSCKWGNWRSQTKHRAKKEDVIFELLCENFENALKGGICQVTGLPFDFSGLQQPDFSELLNPRSDALHELLYPDSLQKKVSHDDEVIHEVTPLTPQRPKQKKVVYNPWVPSVHRQDPQNNRDYSKENTQFVCLAYNIAKSNFGDEDFKILLEALWKNLGNIPGIDSHESIIITDTLVSAAQIPIQEINSIVPIKNPGTELEIIPTKTRESAVTEQLEREKALQQLIIPPDLCEVSDGNWLALFEDFEKSTRAWI